VEFLIMFTHRFPLSLALLSLLHPILAAEESPSGAAMTVESVVLTIAQQAEIAAREPGLLAELLVREGQTVSAGELLARLDDEAAKLAYQRAVVDLERAQKLADNDVKVRLAKKQLEIAQTEFKRAGNAAQRFSKSVTEAELDRLRLDVERTTLELEHAEFEFDSARLMVRIQENEVQSAIEKARRRRITSPLSGMVVEVRKRAGEWVEEGPVIARVIATSKLRAEGFLNADQLGGNWVGRKVRLTLRLPSLDQQRLSGTVVFVSPEVDPVSGQARMWAEIDNPDGRLRPGLHGSLTIE
jgi:macrolide-specific efflux system membrane fusion protein